MAEKLTPNKGIKQKETSRELINTGLYNEPIAPAVVKSKLTIEQQRERDKQLVRGIFRFHEVPGGRMMFVFKKYKGDPLQRYELVDGQEYTIPLGVAKHLTQDVWYPEHENVVDDQGKVIARVGRKIRRCSFESLEFMDIEELTPDNSKIEIAQPVGL